MSKIPDAQVIKTMLALSSAGQCGKRLSDRGGNQPAQSSGGRAGWQKRVKVLLVDEIIAHHRADLSAGWLVCCLAQSCWVSMVTSCTSRKNHACRQSASMKRCGFTKTPHRSAFSAKERVCFNPPMDTQLRKDDAVIAISRDDDTVLLAKQRP